MKKFLAGTALAMLLVSPAEAVSNGRGIPLEMVVSTMVPDTYKVVLADGVDSKAPLSWNGGDNWKANLAMACESADYMARIEGTTITIVPRGRGMTEAVAVARVEVEADTPKVVPVPRKAPARQTASEPKRSSAKAPAAAPKRKTTPKAAVRAHAAPTPSVSGGGFAFIPAEPKRSALYRGTDAKGFAAPRKRAAAPAAPTWTVAPGADLEHVLTGWSTRAGWTIVWDNDFTFSLTSGARFTGTFEQAATQLVQAMSEVRPAPTVEFYRGNKTIVIGADSAGIVN